MKFEVIHILSMDTNNTWDFVIKIQKNFDCVFRILRGDIIPYKPSMTISDFKFFKSYFYDILRKMKI